LATSPCRPRTLAELVNPTDKQREFLQTIAEHDFVLYGGEGGGGKSYILRWWLVLYLVWCHTKLGLHGVRVAIFCETYAALEDRQILKMQAEFPKWLGSLVSKRSTWDFILRPEYGGGILSLRNLDKPEKYASAEFAAIAVDELTKNPLSVFNDLRWRLRWPGIERPKFGAGANPGGIGHAWVKKYWKTRQYPPEFFKPYDITGQFAFVRAQAKDNPHLDDLYWRRLLSLPPEMAKRVAHGDWDVYTGQFYPNFDSEGDPENKIPPRHVITQAEALKRIKPWWTHWISGDWGYEHPHAVYWHAQDEHGHVITYRELWDRRINETELGRRITAANGNQKLQAFAFSWDAGKLSPRSKPHARKSMMQMVTDALGSSIPRPYPADSSPGTRISRARLMSQLIDADMWQTTTECPRLIECIPALIKNEDNPEDVLKVDYTENDIGDDPYDGCTMGLQHMSSTPMLPATEIAARTVQKYAESRGKDAEDLDINATASIHRRALAAEVRKRKMRRGGLGKVRRPQGGGIR
jgi:hypothetical protein